MEFSRSGVKVSASASRLGRYSLTDESRRRQRRNTMHGSRAKRGMMMSASLTRNKKSSKSNQADARIKQLDPRRTDQRVSDCLAPLPTAT